MRALVQLAFAEDRPPDCTRCRNDESIRPEMGCDAPAPRAVFYICCARCGGVGCENCEDGSVPMFRCPGKLLEGRRDIERAFWYCRRSDDGGPLPAGGGLAEQSAQWIEMLRVYQHERGVIEREVAEREERDRIRAEKLAAKRSGVIRG